MTTADSVPFVKMNGLGNDFAVFDARERPLALSRDAVRRIADRRDGVGCDQVIVLEPSEDANLFMRIYNADGGEVDACGNAARCVAALISAESNEIQSTIETNAGILGAALTGLNQVTIDMGQPRLRWDQIPLSEEFQDTRAIELQLGPIDAPALHSPSVINVGNPHCIFWVDDLEAHDLARIGPFLENHFLFPERANISLAEVTGEDALRLKVWERGAGLTKACGTAACAAAVSAARKRLTGRSVIVTLPGGPLQIDWREGDDHMLMTGPFALDYQGTVAPDVLGLAAV